MGDDPRIEEAADLAERILDEVASAEHDWELVARLAADLVALARRLGARSS